MNPKTDPAFPVAHAIDGNWAKNPSPVYSGLTQYAEVAARFHAAILARTYITPAAATQDVFDHADAFFAELAKRTKSP